MKEKKKENIGLYDDFKKKEHDFMKKRIFL